ncbi:MAG: type 1 glutamine amidotransferase domain-containing protein [Phycisphaerales bacterium]
MRPLLMFIVAFLLVVPACTPGKVAEPVTPRVLLVMTNSGTMDDGKPTGLWLAEAAHPYAVFAEAGFAVTLASPAGGAVPIDARSLGDIDAESRDFLNRYGMGDTITHTLSLASADASSYDVIFFAGGHGTMFDFPNERSVKAAAEAIYAKGGIVGAVCHGPAALVQVNAPNGEPIVAGKRVTGFTNDEEAAVDLVEEMPFLLETRLREQGGDFVGAQNFEANVVVDGRLVTGQNPASARGAAEAIVELLK